MAIRVALLSEPWNKTVFGSVKESLNPMLTRDINCRKHCKNADGVQAWVVDPSTVRIMPHSSSLFNTLSRLSSLQQAAFLLGRETVFLALSHDEDTFDMEDEAATLMGDFSLSITVHFLRRRLHLIRGWPWTMVRVVGDGAMAKNCLLKFGTDTNIFREIHGKFPLSSGLQRLYDRYVHQNSSVQSLEHSIKDPTFPSQASKTDFKIVQKDHSACAVPTLIIEEINEIMKGIDVINLGTQTSPPTKSMAITIGSKLINVRYDWNLPFTDGVLGAKSDPTSRSCFKAEKFNRTINWNAIVSSSPRTSCFSRNAENVNQPCADLDMLDSAKRLGDFELVAQAWIGSIAGVKRHLIVQLPGPSGLPGPEEDIRYNQFRDHFKILFDNYTYDKVPLFMPISCEITQEFKAHSYQYNAESPEEAQTWAHMKVRAQFAKTSKRTTMARFASLAGSLESNFGWWHVQLFDATVVALEEDMLKGKVFVDKFCVKALSNNSEGMNPPE